MKGAGINKVNPKLYEKNKTSKENKKNWSLSRTTSTASLVSNTDAHVPL